MDRDPLWYQDDIIYQLHVRAFHDSNGDGVGDFRGLTQKLDYLESLGVTTLWLLPFYPSPLRDDGYDIAKYTDVNPSYGTLDDFQQFLDGAHQRGLRVITELVLNHTSDQHEWFQRARRAPPGSPEREFYVWSDTTDRYEDARIIFQDYEPSNWTWDATAGAYYWHRFFHHQPDLNFENPEVRERMMTLLDFWFERGVDGLRLDAVPYLYEREGTICENLPETHDYLRALRRHVDERFERRMLLAEANQWPEDAAAYFGEGNECHMAFHFPVMPRLFMAVQREDRFPIIDILQQTPQIPANCQWTMFLRNHDELTLEMVTDEERDYMYRVYADDPRARVNVGIRRRLAPLMKNNRRLIELLNGLLFTLPGTPVIYYGDELGMGDNIYLGDRDAVRTPMQWNGDRNAGFSRANPQSLYLPVIVDPEFHYSTVNVEAQEVNRNSMLWWMRRLIALRKRSRVFGRGSIEFLLPDNPKVLAFIRQYEDETVLIVANLSRFAQFVELDLSRFEGSVPTEAFGKTQFPPIGELPYMLTLAEHAFHLFTLQFQTSPVLSIAERSTPTERVSNRWEDVFVGSARHRLEAALPRFLQQQSWFLGASTPIRSVNLEIALPLRSDEGNTFCYLCVLLVEYLDREPEWYAVPLEWSGRAQSSELFEHHPEQIVLRLVVGPDEETGVLHDALGRREFLDWGLRVLADPASASHADLEIVAAGFQESAADLLESGISPQIQPGRPSHTWIRLGDVAMLRLFHCVETETSPSVEMNRFLRQHAPAELVPHWLGSWELVREETRLSMTLAELVRFVPSEGTAWTRSVDYLQRYFEQVETTPAAEGDVERHPPAEESVRLFDLAQREPSERAHEYLQPHLGWMELIGRRTAELHGVLSSVPDDPDFAPQQSTAYYKRSLFQSLRSVAVRGLRQLNRIARHLSADDRDAVRQVLDCEPRIMQTLQNLLETELHFSRIRCHGSYGLDHLLFTGHDFVIFDFQGDLQQSVGERRLKRPALADVAGIIWSICLAAETALRSWESGGGKREPLEPWVDFWFRWSAATFLRGYLQTAEGRVFVPADTHQCQLLLNAELLRVSLGRLSRDMKRDGGDVALSLFALQRLLRSCCPGET